MRFDVLRSMIDILKNRMPGALAMGKANVVGISIHHSEARNDNWLTVSFGFDGDRAACGNAYRAIERLYEMDRKQDAPTHGFAVSSHDPV
jgi:hypothetical protein